MTETNVGTRCAALALAAVAHLSAAHAQPIRPAPAFKGDALVAPPSAGWPTNGGNWYNQRYSPLTQIDRGNVASLKGVWRTRLRGSGVGTKYSGEAQPIVYDGVVYVVTGADDVFALGVDSGEILWSYEAKLDDANDVVCCGWTSRGVGLGDGKVFVGQLDGKLVALDQKTGTVAWSVQAERWQDGLTLTSAPLYYDGLVITGFAGAEYGIRGRVKAFDARDGKLRWTFYTIPGPGELGHDTWPKDNDLWMHGGGSVWQTPAVDPELGLIYFSTGNAGPDYNGGLRAGDNLFTSSVVALDTRTGKYRWHFQTSHHPLWDYDIPTAPLLVDAVKDGRTVKALAQATKQGLLFVLNRETGEPVWPIPEVAVPQGNVPGEWYSPTQPMPPTRYGHQGVAKDDLIDFTPALRAEAERIVADHRIGPIYTPAVPYNPNGPISTLMVMGGSNWPGNSYDPDTKMVYVTASVGVNSMTICRYAEGSVMPHGVCTGRDAGAFGGLRNVGVQGLPLLKPPYGTIAAIDMTKGAVAWEIPNGDTPENIKNHPALAGVSVGRTGRAGQPPGTLSTKTLLIVAEPGYGPTPDGKRGSMLRAYDKRTGRELAALQLPAPQSGSPMTYMLNGRQYLVIAVSSNDYPGELLAYALPQQRPARAGGAE